MSTHFDTISFDGADVATIKQAITAFDEGFGGAPEKLLDGILPALVWMRDEDILDLNAHEIAAYANLKQLASLTDEFRFQDMPAAAREGARDYLVNLEGYEADKPWEHQSEEFKSSHKAGADKVIETLLIH